MRVNAEVTWVLEGKTPDQIPMARMGEYLQQLGALLGEASDVHFARVEKGSTRIVAKVTAGVAAQRVQSRAYAVRDRKAPAEAMAAFRKIENMVKEDRGNARLHFGGATVLRFHGNSPIVSPALTLVDTGTITGKLYSLSEGKRGEINARIRPQQTETYVPCTADRQVGEQLRRYLFEPVRVQGRGTWLRLETGGWVCHALRITTVRNVRSANLYDAIKALQTIEVDWDDDPIATWNATEGTGDAA